MQRERERQGVARGAGDVQELADRRDVGLAVRAVEAFGDVEDEVRAGEGEFLREENVGFEPDDVAEETQSLLHRFNGGAIVPLDECVAASTRWVVETAVGVGFLVVRETDAHVVSGDLLQKRPRPNAVVNDDNPLLDTTIRKNGRMRNRQNRRRFFF